MQATESLRTLLEQLPGRLQTLPPATVSDKTPGSWSVKEELGHLIGVKGLAAYLAQLAFL